MKPADRNYPEVYGLQLVAGRWFNEEDELRVSADKPDSLRQAASTPYCREKCSGNTGLALTRSTNDSILLHSRQFIRQHRPAYKAWGAYIKPKDSVGNAELTEQWLSCHDRYYYDFGVQPDIAVYPSIQDVMEQKDPVLARALAYLKGKL